MNWLTMFLTTAPPWLSLVLQCTLAILLGLAGHALLHRTVRRLTAGFPIASTLVAFGQRPVQLLVPLLLVNVVLADAPDALLLVKPLRHLVAVALLATLTVLSIRLVKAVAEALISRHPIDGADNLRARGVRTQTRVLSRTVMILVGLIGLASILMTFPEIRQIGASLLASAGVAGLVAGIAARPVLGNLIAGLQIAIAQPIRLDDVLIVDGEWGRVEEISGSYVVLCIWDQRRLIIPLEWFIQNPFQNWTRSSSQLIGSVFLWVDYAMPVEVLRQELERVCRATSEWDGRVCVLQVTDTTEQALQLRALVSAIDASKVWDLRCRVREGLVGFIQREYSGYLPRQRTSFENFPESSRTAAHEPPAGGPRAAGGATA
jgi:small-conductance mechanosensitive channel